MNRTPEQEAFIEALLSTTASINLGALAGTGKTTIMVEGVKVLPADCFPLAVAFNKIITEELKQRMPANAIVMTLNSAGHRAWAHQLRKKRLAVDTRKSYRILKELEIEECFGEIMKLVGLAKSVGIVPYGSLGGVAGLVDENYDNWMVLVEDHDISNNGDEEFIINTARDVLKVSIKEAWDGTVDFDDQLYMSALWGDCLARSEVVMVDEAQDISPIQRAMLGKMHTERLIAVGDKHQAIYGFRGADYTSMDALQEMTGATELPLTVSFRCPKAVVRAAQQYVPEFKFYPDAAEGVVRTAADWGPTDFAPGDAILCRNNKPLISLAYQCLREGVGVRVLGRDIGANLKRLAKKFNSGSLDDLYQDVEQWASVEAGKAQAKGREGRAAFIWDKAESLFVVIENCKGNDVEAVCADIDRMFNSDSAPITLSTIHKAKGREWNKVFWLDKHLVPSKYAKTEGQLIQEDNLAYVCTTRAKKELVYIRSPKDDSG